MKKSLILVLVATTWFSGSAYASCAEKITISEASQTIDDTIAATTACEAEKAKTARPWIQLGTLYFQDKQNEKAIQQFEIALKKEPGLPLAYMNLCAAHSELKQQDEAIAACKKGLESIKKGAASKSGWEAKLEYNLAFAYFRKAAFASDTSDRSAEPHFKRVQELAPQIAQTYFFLGYYREYLDQKIDEARALYKKGCDLGDPQACGALEKIASAPAVAPAQPKKIASGFITGDEKKLKEQLINAYVKKGLAKPDAEKTINQIYESLSALDRNQRMESLKSMLDAMK